MVINGVYNVLVPLSLHIGGICYTIFEALGILLSLDIVLINCSYDVDCNEVIVITATLFQFLICFCK